MDTSPNTRGGSGRIWLLSSAFWLSVGLVSSALTIVQNINEDGSKQPLTWNAFHSFEPMLTFLPYVPATVWLWHLAWRGVENSGHALWRGATAAIVVMALTCVLWNRVRFGNTMELPLSIGMFFWSGLHFAAVFGVGVAFFANRAANDRKRELLASELRALRAQLQPHFLFNTLHAIGVTAKQDGATAARMTTLLGDLLRQTLRERDGGLVSLAEEHELLQPYLQLQQLRFGDRLRVDIDLPDDVLAAAVPDLILQPLVENALRHGIEQLPGAGQVVVRARRVNDTLELQVADDGAGVDAAARDGTGLGSTRARLRAMFGERADLQLAPAGVRGTVATLRLPWREVAHAA